MALTRAQLLQGNSSQGTILTGSVQGVSQGTGVIIAANGTISFEASTAAGVMRLNNPSAYNGYVWPGSDGAANQQLTTDGAGNLGWSASGTPAAGLGINITGNIVKVAIPQASAPPAAGSGATQAVVGSMYWDDTLSQLFIYYSNGGSPVWVQAAPSSVAGGTVTSVGIIGTSGIGVISGSPVTTSGNITLAIDVATLPVLP